MGCFLVMIARIASLCQIQIVQGATLLWNADSAASSVSFSCKASPPAFPDPADLWLDLLDLLSGDTVAAAWVHQALHVDCFNPADVRRFCMPWLLDPVCFLSACPHSVSVTVCSTLACYVLLIGASVADAAVPVGERVFAAGLVDSCLSLVP
jgi:hypothetical protein